MNWKQVRLAIILGLLVMLFISPVVFGEFTEQDRNLLQNIAGKGLEIWDNVKSVWKTQIRNQIKIEEIMGTEYQVGDNATIFLQLLNGTETPINDASCYLDIYYPNKTIWYSDTLMTYLSGSDGLYYFEIDNLPNILGVYMISAYCYIPANAFSDEFLDYSKLESYANIEITGDNKIVINAVAKNNTKIYSQILEDTWVNEKFSSYNYGSDYYMYILNKSGYRKISYIMMNITGVTDCDEAKLCLYTAEALYTVNVSIYHVFASWDEAVITWNNQPCGKDFDNSSACNLTPIETKELSPYGWYCWDVTDEVNIELSEGDKNVSFVLQAHELELEKHFTTKEIADPKKSYLNVTIFLPANIEAFIRSIPINLEGTKWDWFSAIYDLNDGNIDFKVLNNSNEVICDELGDISSCAGVISPIKLYANISMTSPDNISPELDRWWVTWGLIEYQEVRGSGEMHISSPSTIGDLWCKIRNFLALLHSTEVTNRTCIDTSTLREDKVIEYVFEGDDTCADCINMSKHQDIFCPWGCTTADNNSFCNPDPMWRNIILLIVIIVILCIVAGLLRLGGII